MENVTFYETRKRELRQQINEAEKVHKEKMVALQCEVRMAEKQLQLLLGGLDSEKILHAEHIITVRGQFRNAGSEKSAALEAAIEQILNGGGFLFHEYVGTKNYDRWLGQFIQCKYGYGPSHGNAVFEIAFTQAIRSEGKPLSPEQIDDAIYYLRNIESIQEAQERAKRAA